MDVFSSHHEKGCRAEMVAGRRVDLHSSRASQNEIAAREYDYRPAVASTPIASSQTSKQMSRSVGAQRKCADGLQQISL